MDLRRIWSAIARKLGGGNQDDRQSLGRQGERAARRYLQRLGWTVIEENSQTRFSELDVIAVDGRTLVFVEVKTRRGDDRREACQAVDARKQRRITQAALAFLKKHHLLEQAIRFDVIAVAWPDSDTAPRIEHIRNAFDSPLRGQFFG